jgi:hypothetical protein
VAKARGYATCMVFGEVGRFVRNVGTRCRSYYFEILLVYVPIRLQNQRRNFGLGALKTFSDVRSRRKLPFTSKSGFASQIAQERTRARRLSPLNAEVR